MFKSKYPVISLALMLTVASTFQLTLGPVLAQSSTAPATSFPLPTEVPDGTKVRIDGSDSMSVINQSLKKDFEQQFSKATVEAQTQGTDAALKKLLAGEVDLAAIGRPLTKEETAKGLVAVPISREKVALIVSPDNPFSKSLTIDQFAKIFRGEIKDWSKVGGTPGPIQLIDRPASSDTRQTFKTYPVFKKAKFEAGATAKPVAQDSTAEVIKALGKSGLGYAIVSQVTGKNDVRTLPMHNTQPDDPRYPFSQPRDYVYKKDASPAVKAFLGFATAPEGQRSVAAAKSAETQGSAATPEATAPVAAGKTAGAEGGGIPGWLWWILPLALLAIGLPWLLGKLRGGSAAAPTIPGAAAATGFVGGAADAAKRGVQGAGDAATGAAGGALRAGGAAAAGGAALAGGAAAAAKSGLGGAVDKASNLADGAIKAGGAAAAGGAALAGGAAAAAKSGLGGAVDKASNLADGAVQAGGAAISEGTSKVAGVGDAAKSGLKNVAGAGLGAVAAAGAAVAGGAAMAAGTSTKTMKAVRLQSYGGPEVLTFDTVPHPVPKDDEVLIRNYAAGVNPVDVAIRSGQFKDKLPLSMPLVLGYEAAGVVAALGSAVKDFALGDSVFTLLEMNNPGAYAPYVTNKASLVARKPHTLDHNDSAVVPVVGLTAWQALIDTAQLQPGQRVLIHGASGGVGCAAVQLAKWKGAYVFATTSSENIDRVRSLGADEVIDYQTQRFEEVAKDVDLVLDTVGGETQQRSWQTLRQGGLLVSTVGVGDSPVSGVRSAAVFVQAKGKEQLEQLAALIDEGHLQIPIEKTFELPDAAKAHEALQQGHRRGKFVLNIPDIYLR
jgi:NADPH:quinone reductase-like Zn-dependent oxidoreductase/ABC-type phosphate transport system substrate-binding protein